MESEEPELIVLIQESDYKIFKEICIDGEEVSFHDKCCVENCELDHGILSGLLNSELEIQGNLRTEAPDVVSFVSNHVSESFHQHECIMEVRKEFNSEVLLMESSVCVKYAELTASSSKNLEAQTSVLFDSFLHRGEKENNQVPGDTVLATSMLLSSSSKALGHASESCGFKGDDADNGKTIGCDSFKSTVSCIEGSTEQDFAITDHEKKLAKAEEDEILVDFSKKPINDPDNSSYGDHHPGSSTSLRSNSSSASTRSFAFPILPSEWYDSPIRMAEADGKNLRKRKQWRTRFICCNF